MTRKYYLPVPVLLRNNEIQENDVMRPSRNEPPFNFENLNKELKHHRNMLPWYRKETTRLKKVQNNVVEKTSGTNSISY